MKKINLCKIFFVMLTTIAAITLFVSCPGTWSESHTTSVSGETSGTVKFATPGDSHSWTSPNFNVTATITVVGGGVGCKFF